MAPTSFFKGLKVVELASVLAGPAVGMFFAELGAEVIKIENARAGGDVTRSWKLPSETPGQLSAYYCSVNYHKDVRLLDLQSPAAREEVYALLAQADVVLSNFKPSSARKLGMDYATLSRLNPRLIYGQITAFGEGEDLPAFDIVLQAEAGFLYMTGEPGGKPVRMPVALIDLLAAHQLKEGILLALLQRERTGQGALVSASLLESAIASLANQASNWLMAGHLPERMGCMHPNIAPYGDIFYAQDGKPLVLAIGNDQQFLRLCACLGLDGLPQDERFASNPARVRHREALRQALAPPFQNHPRAEWMRRFAQHGVPAGSIRDMAEVFERPAARAMVLEEWIDGQLTKRVKTVAFGMEGAAEER
jgi:crotonobetainyl-CoA:carnitine CoA-transferase CaiB-like acyl-CoA transferase